MSNRNTRAYENVKSQIGFCGIWCGSCDVGYGTLRKLTQKYKELVTPSGATVAVLHPVREKRMIYVKKGGYNMRKLFIGIGLALSVLVIHYSSIGPANAADAANVESLKAAHRKYLEAWSNRDIDTIVEMGTGSAGFGHSTAFPRPIRVRETFGPMVRKFYETMDVFSIEILTENYNVVGTTGLAWGHYAQTTKQKDGPRRTVYLRYAHTFALVNGVWKLVMYHRSLIPNEDFQ